MKPAVGFRGVPEVLLKYQRWDHRHQNRNRHHNRRVNPGKPINKFFLSCFVFLGISNQGDDPLNGVIGCQTANLHLKHSLPVYRTRKNFITHALGHEPTFTCDGSLVNFAVSPSNQPIHRKSFTCPNKDAISNLQGFDWNQLLTVPRHQQRLVRSEIRKFRQDGARVIVGVPLKRFRKGE